MAGNGQVKASPAAECKIIITLKSGAVMIEGNPGNVDLCRQMLCAAIAGIENHWNEHQSRIVKPAPGALNLS